MSQELADFEKQVYDFQRTGRSVVFLHPSEDERGYSHLEESRTN